MSAPTDAFHARRRNRVALFATILALLAVTAVASIMVGQFELSPGELWPIITAGPMSATSLDASVVWQIRLPRLVLGLFVGAALGVGGALMQAVFANPLAEPSVIGVSTGAGVGAAVALVFGINALGTMTVPVFAFASGIAAEDALLRIHREGAVGAGAEAHHGMTVAGFPNLFVLYGPNTNLSVGSIVVMMATCGRTIFTSGVISPAWFMPISNTAKRVLAGQRANDNGTPQ